MKRVADQGEGRSPEAGPDQAPGEKGTQAHLRSAGQEGGHGTNDSDEAPEQDCPGSVLSEEVFNALQAWCGYAQPRAASEQKAASQSPAEPDSSRTPRAAAIHAPEAHGEIDSPSAAPLRRALLLSRPAPPAQRCAGFKERQAGHERVSPGADRVRRRREQRLQVRRLDEPAITAAAAAAAMAPATRTPRVNGSHAHAATTTGTRHGA